ncbi:hypothetical protein GCM10027270_28530 [Nocardioides ginkgobilobae]
MGVSSPARSESGRRGRAFDRAHLSCNRSKVSSATAVARRTGWCSAGAGRRQCVDTAVEDYSLSCRTGYRPDPVRTGSGRLIATSGLPFSCRV